jgi:nucleoid-associated protein YgaU
MIWRTRGASLAGIVGAALTLPVSNVTVAFAQQTAPGAGPDQGTPSTSSTGAPTTPGGPTTTTTVSQVPSPYSIPGNPQSANGTIGGGNASESSAHPVTGDQEDTFDIGQHGGAGAGSAYGDANGPIFMGQGQQGLPGYAQVPFQHVVRKGDTLSGICDAYFHNPYQWPRIWSYNPQIQNPHWIYPGDLVRLRTDNAGMSLTPQNGAGASIVDRQRRVPQNTVFLRDQGYIEDHSDQDWGEITGAPEDKMFLTNGDDLYLHVGGTRDVHVGQELTVFIPVRKIGSGSVIELLGSVRVNEWNPSERVARATVTESLDVIERGARVGPVGRRFEVVAPVRNLRDITAHVLASVHPHNFFGANQVLFIDKGGPDGVLVGNRFFVIRKGDAWRRSLATPGAGYRISPEAENMPDVEKTPGTHDEAHYPDEVVGELRVLEVREKSSTCLVTESKAEIERDDVAVARKGY